MSWLARLFSPLRRLFGRGPARRRFEPLDLAQTPPAETLTPPPEPSPAPPPPSAEVFPPLPDTAASVEVEEGEDAFEEEELAEDADADLDVRPDLDVLVAERHARLSDTRREAERVALEGEQRVRLTDPAGPGTLAETLARLEGEGRVASTLQEDEGEPVLVYVPVAAPCDPAPATPH